MKPSVILMGLWILPVCGVIWIIGSPLRGNLPDPASSAVAFTAAVAAPSFFWGTCINLIGLFMATFGFMALFAYLTLQKASHTALGGMLLIILGQETILSFYGIFVLILPWLGQMQIPDIIQADFSAAVLTNPVFLILYILSGLFYVAGSILFSIAMIRHSSYPKWVAVCFSLSGFVLCLGPVFKVPVPVSNIIGSLLLILSSGWIALLARRQSRPSSPSSI